MKTPVKSVRIPAQTDRQTLKALGISPRRYEAILEQVRASSAPASGPRASTREKAPSRGSKRARHASAA